MGDLTSSLHLSESQESRGKSFLLLKAAYMHIDEVGLQKSSAKVDFIQVPCEERNTRTKTKRWINEDQNDKKRAFYCLLLY